MNFEQLLPLAESIFENWDVEKFYEGLLVTFMIGNIQRKSYKL